MNTISTIQHQQPAPFFVKQEEQEKIALKELQNDQVQIKGGFAHVEQKDFDRIANWNAQDAQNALSRIHGKELTSVHGYLDQDRVRALINRFAA